MEITLRGVRGSFPVSSPHAARYGGNTPCIQVEARETCLIIDAGTGIFELGKELVRRDQRDIHLLISHTHWDHIHGFPHFAPLHQSGFRVHIYSLAHPECSIQEILSDQQKEPFFPMALDRAPAELHFTDLSEGQRLQIGPVAVQCERLNHPSYTGGFRLECGGKTLSYVSDTDLYGPRLHGEGMKTGSEVARETKRIELQERAVELARGADLMVFDSFFLPEEYKDDWGHSTVEDALRLGKEADARSIAFFHHAPGRSDEQLDEVVAHYRTKVPNNTSLLAAAEGGRMVL